MRHVLPVSLLVLATSAGAGSFQQLHQAARSHDAQYAAARAQFEADREYRALGRAGLYPSIVLTGQADSNDYGRRDLATSQSSDHDYTSRSLSLRLVQPLYDARRWAQWQEGGSRVRLAEINFADAGQDLSLRYAQAYFDYLLARDTLELAGAQKAAIAAQKEQAENLYKGGSATVTDIEETKARLLLAEADELAAGNAVDIRLRELERLVGTLPGKLAEIKTLVPVRTEPADPKTWINEAKFRNYKILAQQISGDIAQQQLDQARSGHYPIAELVMSAQASDDPNYYTARERSSRIGLQVSLPLYEGGRVVAQTRQAGAQRERARQELENALREAEVRTGQYFLDLRSGVTRIQALEAAMRSSEITLEGMKAGQKVGMRTNTDVLNAQKQLYDVRRSLQQERYAYLLNSMRLQAMVGGLNEDEVTRIDRLIAP